MRFIDGLKSLALKLGNKQETAFYERSQLLTQDTQQLEALWVENWVASKICIKRAEDMTRRWREVYSNELDAKKLEVFEQLERKLKLREVLNEALAWSSLYGSVGILLITDNTQLGMPLTEKEQLQRLVVLPKWRITPLGSRDDDVLSANFGKYPFYTIGNGSQAVTIHYSRLIILNAGNAPLSGDEIWGVSDLEKVLSVLKRFDGASGNIGDLIYESKIDVFRIDGLADKISAGLENDVAKTVTAIQSIKSATNSLLLDTNNEYEQKELAFGGLKDLLVEFRNAVAGAADMPVTILFGQSAAGFASGEEDIQNYHESIHRLQEKRLRPVLERLDVILCNMAFGGMPSDWWFEFMPLKELKQDQQITMLNTFADATNKLLQNGVINEVQIANELKESGLFANISGDDIAEMEKLANDTEFTPSREQFDEAQESDTL